MPSNEDVPPLTLQDVINHVRALHERQGWPKRSPEQRALYLVSEIGELASALIEFARAEQDNETLEGKREAVGDEMSDIIWNVCDLAEILSIDLESAILTKQKRMLGRTWR